MDKKTIIAIVGNSGSGKTALCKYLKSEYGIPYIVSYTTRPMRDGEVNGADHIFVSEKDMPDRSEMLAYTLFGENHYWALHSQVKDVVCYTIDEIGLIELRNRWKDRYNIFSVYIKRENYDVGKDRMNRDNGRVRLDENDYDLIIVNSGDLMTFLTNASKKIIDSIN